ncbi:uncharacterized acetyltransferase At3g50280-like [Humulus lupulus]|uniref:uncharacterized acetyltransferase At3g50280-like n=1 Tax=Humulus lupulus TaxID=3486 RepID=UPI002B4121B2|nr:uncharacterized acetyltransferase At3g50280-like [Humulus lupulus]
MKGIGLRFISTTLVQQASLDDEDDNNHSELISERLELTPSDLGHLKLQYIQNGLLFHHKPPSDTNFVRHLAATLSRTLDIFYPLAGRLVITRNDDETACFHVECNGSGVLFSHAVTDGAAVADIIGDSVIVPNDFVYSLFLLNGVSNYEAAVSKLPLVAVQVTELVDGFFIGCSMNHVVIDGTSFWNFFNVWSEISRDGSYYNNNDVVLSTDRRDFFLGLPIRVPSVVELPQPTSSSSADHLQQMMIHFSKKRIVELKAKANAEMGFTTNNEISSLQALMAHLWRSVTRGRDLNADEDVHYIVTVGLRSRLLQPALPEGYLGNAVHGINVQCKAGELLDRGLGWAAAQIKQGIGLVTPTEARKKLEDWVKSPRLSDMRRVPRNLVISGGSPRFNVYGNDFGWGSPVAVRSGPANKYDGSLTPYSGAEEGSVDFEVCSSLSPATLLDYILN